MNKKKYRGVAGEIELDQLLDHDSHSSTVNTSIGFYEGIVCRDGRFIKATVPNVLNGGGEDFYGESIEITEEEAKRLISGRR